MKEISVPKITLKDLIVIAVFAVFLILVTIPVYRDKHGCEVARPGYKCMSAKQVMIENCEYWAKYDCDSSQDISLPQIEWYIKNLCEIANRNHGYGFDCENPKLACNQVLQKDVCPLGV
jgi:hypothetical protein